MPVEKDSVFETFVTHFISEADKPTKELANRAFAWYLLPKIKQTMSAQGNNPVYPSYLTLGHFAWQAMGNEINRLKMVGKTPEALGLAQFSLRKASIILEEANIGYHIRKADDSVPQLEFDLVLQAAADQVLAVADKYALTVSSEAKPLSLDALEQRAFKRATTFLLEDSERVKTLFDENGAREIMHALSTPVLYEEILKL